MLRNKVERLGSFPAIPDTLRRQAHRKRCQPCGVRYGDLVLGQIRPIIRAREHIDHIIPRRYLTRLGLDPNKLFNVLSSCQRCHGRKKEAEDALFRGDTVGFLLKLARLGWPTSKILKLNKNYALGLRCLKLTP